MSETQPRLPDFADPPVIEVALSVQFESLSGFGTPHIGLLWSEFRNEFPRTEEHPPRPSVIERFGVRRAPKTDFRVEAAFPVPQCRFLNDRGTELIQIQQDRFVHNWRKVGQGDVYPRYEFVRRRFEEELGIFHRFLARENLGELIPNQCEVTYVNHIISGTGWERHGELGEILTVWKTRNSDAFFRSQRTSYSDFVTSFLMRMATQGGGCWLAPIQHIGLRTIDPFMSWCSQPGAAPSAGAPTGLLASWTSGGSGSCADSPH